MPDFQLSYNNVPLNLDDGLINDEAHLREWIGQNIPLDDARITLPERPWPGPGLLSITRQLRQPHRPKLRTGEWFYPTGASRWSEVHLIVAEDVYARLPTPGGSHPFQMQQNGVTLQSNLYMLPARPIAKFGTWPGLYLISLVDERYFWQFQNAGSIHQPTDWESLISTLAAALGIGLTFSVNEVYGQPQPLSDFDSEYENAAILLDAALWNCGLTLVRSLDGSYSAMDVETSSTFTGENKQEPKLAGGEFTTGQGAIMPQSVLVTFPKRLVCSTCNPVNPWVNPKTTHLPYSRNLGDFYPVTVSINDAGYGGYGGYPYQETMHDQAEAWLMTAADTIPQNEADLQSLALQLAKNYYASQVDGLDVVYPLLVNWTPEGLHDLTWTWSGVSEKCCTRVQRKPYNYLAGIEYLHHFPAPLTSSSSSSSSSNSESSNSGNGVGVVTKTCCDEYEGLTVECGTITGYVVLNGQQVPVHFDLTPTDCPACDGSSSSGG